jgi:hypothetical protein
MPLFRIVLVFASVFIATIINPFNKDAIAVFIKPDSVLLQVLEKNRPVAQFYAETKVSVYDPESFAPLDEETNAKLQPYEIVDKAYSQRVVFVRDEFLSIETLSESGTPLHIYIEEFGGARFFQSLNRDRFFAVEDVQMPATFLFTKHLSLVRSGLNNLGIVPSRLEIDHQKYLILYLIGSKENHLLVDTNSFKVLGLRRSIQIQGRYYPMTIVFSELDKKKKSIPLTSRFYINSRLIKEIRIEKMRFSSIFSRRNAIMRKYKHLIPTDYPFSMSINWGQ